MDTSIMVITWNIGDNFDKIQSLINSINKKPDILILGLQELKTMGIVKTLRIQGYTYLNSYTTCMFLNFKLGVIIFISEQMKNNSIKSSEIKSFCENGTKGYILVKIIIENKEILLANCHFPFKNINLLKSFHDKLIEDISDTNMKNVIIFGDLNSRSLITGSYTKDIEVDCSDKTSIPLKVSGCDKNYCEIKNYLENTYVIEDHSILDCLSNTDALINYKLAGLQNPLFQNYSEKLNKLKMPFVPTYKLNSKTKKYKLEKDGKYRLPGYPDRILYTFSDKDIISTEYNSVSFFGNDHFPVYGLFQIKNNKLSSEPKIPKKLKSLSLKRRRRSIIRNRRKY
jgi:hypothetical protein